jgi:hypothetical protein
VAPFVTLLEDVEHAEAEAELRLLRELQHGDEEKWQRKAWVLERRWPGRWAQRVRTAVAEEVGTIVSKLREDPEMTRRVLVAVDEAAPGTAPAAH